MRTCGARRARAGSGDVRLCFASLDLEPQIVPVRLGQAVTGLDMGVSENNGYLILGSL